MKNPFKPSPVALTIEEDKLFDRSHFSRFVRAKLYAGKCSTEYIQELMRESAVKCCLKKKQHTEGSAQAALGVSPGNHTYVCPSCSFLHIGRPCDWAILAEKKIEQSKAPVTKLFEAIKGGFKC